MDRSALRLNGEARSIKKARRIKCFIAQSKKYPKNIRVRKIKSQWYENELKHVHIHSTTTTSTVHLTTTALYFAKVVG